MFAHPFLVPAIGSQFAAHCTGSRSSTDIVVPNKSSFKLALITSYTNIRRDSQESGSNVKMLADESNNQNLKVSWRVSTFCLSSSLLMATWLFSGTGEGLSSVSVTPDTARLMVSMLASLSRGPSRPSLSPSLTTEPRLVSALLLAHLGLTTWGDSSAIIMVTTVTISKFWFYFKRSRYLDVVCSESDLTLERGESQVVQRPPTSKQSQSSLLGLRGKQQKLFILSPWTSGKLHWMFSFLCCDHNSSTIHKTHYLDLGVDGLDADMTFEIFELLTIFCCYLTLKSSNQILQ